MELCIFSRHIPKLKTDASVICGDLDKFNRAVHKAYMLNLADKDSLKTSKETGKPDMRLKENRDKAGSREKSTHMLLKEKYGFNDYFANSANQQAKAVLRSVKELHSANKNETKETLKAVLEKEKRTQSRLAELQKTKACLVAISKHEKTGKGKHRPKLRMPKGGAETWDKETGVFTVWYFHKRTKERKAVRTFENAVLFELQYLDPKIRQLKGRLTALGNRIRKLEARLKRMEDLPGVCFGSKAFFKKQHTVYKNDHDAWKRRFQKKRTCGMTISGRRDSKNGNWVFRYDAASRTLYYRSMCGKEITIPGFEFPYGQELLEDYLVRQATEKSAPVAWRIEETGGSFLIKCILHLPDSRKNDYYGDGCVGLDTNVDCLALTEVDDCGNLLSHRIVPFDLRGLSSGQAEHVLSKAMDEVFRFCTDRKKPLVMEDLHAVASTETYGSKKLNRKLSGFAHTKIRTLAVSKSRKYDTVVTFVNPAFTSQIGKVKYMSRYGLAIHEAAAMAIARRGMGLKDRIPKGYLPAIPKEKIARHHWTHWRHLQKGLKQSLPPMFYRRVRRIPKSTNVTMQPCAVTA